MSPISEDEPPAELDEPDDQQKQIFVKTRPRLGDMRRTESLLTKAFHTDFESHEDDHRLRAVLSHNPSISSTCSTFSGRSAGDFTSDDGHTSPGTRASTPSSPKSSVGFAKQSQLAERTIPKVSFPSRQGSNSSRSSNGDSATKPTEPTIEAELGRKRCISFVCGRKDTNTSISSDKTSDPTPAAVAEPPKRACAIKFLFPSKALNTKPTATENHRRPSPAPINVKPTSPVNSKRVHRDSDATIKNESPVPESPAVKSVKEQDDEDDDEIVRSEATRFHEFASSDDETEDWVRQSTCHRSPLTVSDTLKKENVIRRIAEEAEAEAIEEDEEVEDDEDVDDAQTDFFSGEEEDAGFQTDDEEGFAASDDDSDDDSDYEWWAPRRTPTMSPFIPSNFFRPSKARNSSNGSIASTSEALSPTERPQKSRKKKVVSPVVIRSNTSELPDSTDFVCGTLDEDRPMEQAYLNNRKEREAAKHRPIPQDIDPTFPTSDPEIEKDDDNDDEELTDQSDEVDDIPDHPSESEQGWAHNHFEQDDDSVRGRKHVGHKRSPHHSPRRLRSPPPPAITAAKRGRSPAPRGMFHNSPGRMRSPPPPNRLTSPPPSRRGSAVASPAPPSALQFGQNLLGARNHDLTHTASLPRSPHPFLRRRRSSNITAKRASPTPAGSGDEDFDDDDDDDDNDNDSLGDKPYTRGAIDIVQGLEQKRLKRREKLYKQYWKREEKKKHHRRPQPGRGAERMKQVGIECAIYRGKRILSI